MQKNRENANFPIGCDACETFLRHHQSVFKLCGGCVLLDLFLLPRVFEKGCVCVVSVPSDYFNLHPFFGTRKRITFVVVIFGRTRGIQRLRSVYWRSDFYIFGHAIRGHSGTIEPLVC